MNTMASLPSQGRRKPDPLAVPSGRRPRAGRPAGRVAHERRDASRARARCRRTGAIARKYRAPGTDTGQRSWGCRPHPGHCHPAHRSHRRARRRPSLPGQSCSRMGSCRQPRVPSLSNGGGVLPLCVPCAVLAAPASRNASRRSRHLLLSPQRRGRRSSGRVAPRRYRPSA